MNVIDLALWACAAGLGVATLWWARPRPVALDWERFFKLSLVTLLRGQVEAEEGGAADWARLGRGRVWFSAAGRFPLSKLMNPDPSRLPVPALPGELALCEALAALSEPGARLARLYASEQDAELYEEPESAGPLWRLPQYLGQGADWDSLASWGEAISAALTRKGQQVWIQLDALDLPLPEFLPRAHRIKPSTPEDTAKAIDALGPAAADRFVLLATGKQAQVLIHTLHSFDGLRDRVLAVILLEPELQEEQGWLAENFNHSAFDTELARPTGWFVLRFLSLAPTQEELLAKSQALPEPPPLDTGRLAIERVDLGLLPGSVERVDPSWLARGLVVTVLAWLGSRG